jgi:RHS repeat-associated protein
LTKAFVPLPAGETAVFNASGLTYYRHPDWIGSSRLASTPSRTLYSETAYAPFGESYTQSGTTDLSFTGQNQDTIAGLYDFMFREYSPGQGRWISPDPAGLAAVDITDPQTWNRYAYVGNSPLNRIDPDGQDDDGGDDGGGFSPLLPPDFGEGIGWGGSLAGVDINKYCTNDPFNAAPVPLCGPDQGGGGITIILGGGSGGGSGGGGGGGGSSNGGFGGVGSNPANNFPNGETLGVPDWLTIRPWNPWDFLPGHGCEFGPCSSLWVGLISGTPVNSVGQDWTMYIQVWAAYISLSQTHGVQPSQFRERLARLGNCAKAYYGIGTIGTRAAEVTIALPIPKRLLGLPVMGSRFTNVISRLALGRGTAISGENVLRIAGRWAGPIAIASLVIDAAAIGTCTALD